MIIPHNILKNHLRQILSFVYQRNEEGMIMIRRDELREFRPDIRFLNGQEISLEKVCELLKEYAEQMGIPVNLRKDTVKMGGVFSKTQECVVMFHPEHEKDYFKFCIIVSQRGKYTFVSVKDFGHSKQMDKAQSATNAKEHLKKSFTVDIGKGETFMGAGFQALGAIPAGLKALGTNKGKLEEEKMYYQCMMDIFNKIKELQCLNQSAKYNNLDLCLKNELSKKDGFQYNENSTEEIKKEKTTYIKRENKIENNFVKKILIVGIIVVIAVLAISSADNNDYTEDNDKKNANNMLQTTEKADTFFEENYQNVASWEEIDDEVQQETDFINSDFVIQEEKNCFGEYLGIVNEEVHYADPNIGGYDYTYYSLDFGKECSLWCNYYAEDTIGEISVSCISLSGEFDWNNLVGKKIRVQGKVIDNARGDQMILVNDILEIIEK